MIKLSDNNELEPDNDFFCYATTCKMPKCQVPCGDCDLPGACADFGCAIEQGLKESETF